MRSDVGIETRELSTMSMTWFARVNRSLRQPTPLIFVTIAAIFLIASGYTLSLFAPANPAPHLANAASPLLSGTVPIQPKPFDKFLFFGLMPFVALVLFAVTFAAHRLRAAPKEIAPLFLSLTAASAIIAVFCGAFSGIGALTVSGQWLWTALCLIVAAIFIWKAQGAGLEKESRINNYILLGSMVTSAVILGGMRIWLPENIEYSATFTSHYEAVTLAPIRIAAGGTCLADVIAQYGCNGEFVAPILRLLGRSVFAVTMTYAFLQIGAVWVVFYFARSIVSLPSLFLASVLCVFIEAVLNLTPTANDVVLQYHPVRFLFPALSLIVMMRLQNHQDLRHSALAGLFSGAAICWNLEAGLAVLLSLAAFIFVGSLSNPLWRTRGTAFAAGARICVYTAAAVLFAATFVLYLNIKSGRSIDLSNYVIFQATFYQTGFGMLPIPAFPDYWTIHAAIVLCVLIIAAMHVGAGPDDDKVLERAAYLAILAIGLSLYFSGRSHVRVLKLVAWPDAILFFYLANRAMRGARLTAPNE